MNHAKLSLPPCKTLTILLFGLLAAAACTASQDLGATALDSGVADARFATVSDFCTAERDTWVLKCIQRTTPRTCRRTMYTCAGSILLAPVRERYLSCKLANTCAETEDCRSSLGSPTAEDLKFVQDCSAAFAGEEFCTTRLPPLSAMPAAAAEALRSCNQKPSPAEIKACLLSTHAGLGCSETAITTNGDAGT